MSKLNPRQQSPAPAPTKEASSRTIPPQPQPQPEPVKPAWAEPSGEAAGPSAPGHEEVAIRAFELWVSEGSPHGRDRDHWFEAERQLRKP